MELIRNLEIKPFTQLVWVSEGAKKTWLPVIKKFESNIGRLEIESVAADHRECAWQNTSPERLQDLTKYCMERNLLIFPISAVGAVGSGFAHRSYPVEQGKPININCIITKNQTSAVAYEKAYRAGDNITQGKLLGFPDCCTEYFAEYWKAGYVDPIWQIANNTPGKQIEDGKTIMIETARPYSIPILRYIGLRIGFHIPCSFNCFPTCENAEKRISLLLDYEESKKLFMAIMSMPMEWSCLHGIAIIKTPIFYLRTNTVGSTQKYTVRIMGKFIPRESLVGTKFPFNIKGD